MASRPPLGIALADALGAQPEQPQVSRGQMIAGILADALAGAMGRPGQFAQMQERRQQSADEEAQWGRHLMMQKRLEQQYEKPPAPHYFETNNGSVGVIGEDGQPKIIYNDPTPKMNFIPDGLGGGQWVAVPTQAPSAPMPTKPIGTLTPVDGGPTQPASGSFPRY